MTNKELATYIQEKLLNEGVIIQRYDAYSTDSIYMKLDFGVCNSIRISGHKGKKYLKYRYNIGQFVRKFAVVKDGYERFYYRADKSDELVKKVISDRNQKIEQFGETGYKELMLKNQSQNSGKAGFWKSARVVVKEL